MSPVWSFISLFVLFVCMKIAEGYSDNLIFILVESLRESLKISPSVVVLFSFVGFIIGLVMYLFKKFVQKKNEGSINEWRRVFRWSFVFCILGILIWGILDIILFAPCCPTLDHLPPLI